MIVGPRSTKLPQSWDTGSDQPSAPAMSTSVCAISCSWRPVKPRTGMSIFQIAVHFSLNFYLMSL